MTIVKTLTYPSDRYTLVSEYSSVDRNLMNTHLCQYDRLDIHDLLSNTWDWHVEPNPSSWYWKKPLEAENGLLSTKWWYNHWVMSWPSWQTSRWLTSVVEKYTWISRWLSCSKTFSVLYEGSTCVTIWSSNVLWSRGFYSSRLEFILSFLRQIGRQDAQTKDPKVVVTQG